MDKDLKSWYVHDSNGKLSLISDYIKNYIITGDVQELQHALGSVNEHFHMNDILYKESKDNRSVAFNVNLWARYKNYPKVEVIVKNDFNLSSLSKILELAAICSEMKANAHKADATLLSIVIDTNVVVFINNGKLIENPDKIFESGYSSFGTSGVGLNYMKKICEYMKADLLLTNNNPVEFTVKFN